ncbi:hypothetical protein D9M72_234090 [compost metagenome]
MERSNRTTELDAVLGKADRRFQRGLGDAQRRKGGHAATDIQVLLGNGEGFAGRAQQVFLRDFDVVEEQFAQRAAVHAHFPDRRTGNAGHRAFENEAGDTVLAVARGGPNEDDAKIANRPVGDIELTAVDAPAVGRTLCTRLHIGGIRADVRLAQRETGDRLAAEDTRQVLLAQGGTAIFRQHERGQVADREHASQRRPDPRDLGNQHAVGRGRQAEASVLFRHQAADQAEVAHCGDECARHRLLLCLVAIDYWRHFFFKIAPQ